MEMNRRDFFAASAAFAASGMAFSGCASAPKAGESAKAKAPVIQGFDEEMCMVPPPGAKPFVPFSDKKVRVGVAGCGVCSFGAAFEYDKHPNIEVVAVTDLDPVNCSTLARGLKAKRTYQSCEEMIEAEAKAGTMDAVYIATDAPSHARLSIMALEHGMHVCVAVPAVFGIEQLEDAERILDLVRRTKLVYQMNETTAFRPNCYAMRELYKAGKLGTIVYSEGEYFHPKPPKASPSLGIGSYGGWRRGLPPQYYPTHSNGYYTCVTGKAFTEVSCMGFKNPGYPYKGGTNRYGNEFADECALFRTEDGGMSRMIVSWGTAGHGAEDGRVYGTTGCYRDGKFKTWGGAYAVKIDDVDTVKYALPPGMRGMGHGGSHGYLTDDFIRAILLKRSPVVNVEVALATTVAGIIAHQSAVKGGELMKIPQFKL